MEYYIYLIIKIMKKRAKILWLIKKTTTCQKLIVNVFMSDKSSEINRLIDIVDLLRSPDGCPWDKEQTSESLITFFIEEVYEAVESIEKNNYDLKEELGDVLLHIVFQSSIANEKGYFNFNDVLQNIIKKLIKRHPHIFNNSKDKISFDKKSWEKNKQ